MKQKKLILEKRIKFLMVCSLLIFLGNIFIYAQENSSKKNRHLHPSDIAVPKEMKIPKEFPLDQDKKLTCDSCHGVKGLQEKPLNEIDPNQPGFIRGGPYKKLIDFCYTCHEQKGYKRTNLHKMLDEEGKRTEKKCLFCHVKMPDPKQVTDWKTLEFRLEPDKLCVSCHSNFTHFNSGNHLIRPSEKVNQRRVDSEKKLQVILPLGSKEHIMCATCHTPHEKGVIEPANPGGKQIVDVDVEKGIEYVDSPWNKVFQEDKKERLQKLKETATGNFTLRYQKVKSEVLLRLPAKDGTLCLACHHFEK